MNRLPTAADVLEVLTRRPASVNELGRRLGGSRATIQRLLAAEREELLTVGRARATRYARKRPIDGVRAPVPVYEIDEVGAVGHVATLHPVHPLGYYVEARSPGIWAGFAETDPMDPGPDRSVDLPWFLLDQKPSGFLARRWLEQRAGSGWPRSLAQWTGDDVLRYAALFGTDGLGAFVIGDPALELVQRGVGLPEEAPSSRYVELAERAMTVKGWGSSLGGDQPKFLVRRPDGVDCLVKFSPPIDTTGGRRWADLLTVEHRVHELLHDRKIAAARSRVLDLGGRRFLEVERFDRVGASGRSGVVSLFALDRAGVANELRSWSVATHGLVREGRLSRGDHEQVDWLEGFGHLIANSDMHAGNLSFRLRGTTLLGIAPVYDMLPMFYAPRHGGELPSGVYRPSAERERFPGSAIEAARELWTSVEREPSISGELRAVARAQGAELP